MIVLIQTLFILIFIYLAFNIVYLLFFSIAGKIRNYKPYTASLEKKKIAILIPAYKDDQVIIHTAVKASRHNYPTYAFDVFVAADQLKRETVETLRAIPVNVEVMNFEGRSSKAKSLNTLINSIDEGRYDLAMILDSDNVMDQGCLEKVNAAFNSGYKCVQLHRTAKNANTDMAVLDGISEEINNTIFRNGQRALGFSSALIGSGMAFEFALLKRIFNLPSILENAGEDREVDTVVIKEGLEIEYIPDADVYDEKVSSGDVFQTQRLRWMEAQLNHISIIFSASYFKGKKTKDFWNRIVINCMPPRLLIMAAFIPVLVLWLVFKAFGLDFFKPAPVYWAMLFVMLCASLLIALPSKLVKPSILFRATTKIFSATIRMIRGIFLLNPSRKEFLHTPKAYTEEIKEVF